jgi:hypothetical protein
MENNEGHVRGIKKSVEDIIGSTTSIKLKRKSGVDSQKEKFEKIILSLEELDVRSLILGGDLGLDFTAYDEKFYAVIDALFQLHFNKEVNELIFFYLYERINEDGSFNKVVDIDGIEVELNNPSDLWAIIRAMEENSKKKK